MITISSTMGMAVTDYGTVQVTAASVAPPAKTPNIEAWVSTRSSGAMGRVAAGGVITRGHPAVPKSAKSGTDPDQSRLVMVKMG